MFVPFRSQRGKKSEGAKLDFVYDQSLFVFFIILGDFHPMRMREKKKNRIMRLEKKIHIIEWDPPSPPPPPQQIHPNIFFLHHKTGGKGKKKI